MTFGKIFQRFRFGMSLTLFLVLLEGILSLLFPLFIGFAINDAIKGIYKGAILLGGLGVGSLLIGATRRFYDSRFYAKVYTELGYEIGMLEGLSSSTKTARLSMLGEIVEFFENAAPQIINSIIALLGTLIIVASLNIKIFAGCLVILLLIFAIYSITKKRTIRFNKGYNNALEQQVEILTQKNKATLNTYLQNLMKWNVKLSDLETMNFSIVWILMMLFLVISIIWSVEGGAINYGAVFALVMYVFQYIESVISLPFFYQQWLRLEEIFGRLNTLDLAQSNSQI